MNKLVRVSLHARCMTRKRRLSMFHMAGIYRELKEFGGALLLLSVIGILFFSVYILSMALSNMMQR